MDLVNTYFVLDTSNIDEVGFGVVWSIMFKSCVCLCCLSGIGRIFLLLCPVVYSVRDTIVHGLLFYEESTPNLPCGSIIGI